MIETATDRLVRFKARWIFPVSGSPIQNGMIEVQNRIITAMVPQSDASAIDLGSVALIPGLINAHTHLEFSDLQAPVQPAEPFTSWIQALVAVRRGRPADNASIQAGLKECLANGTTAVGEIATQSWPTSTYQILDAQTAIQSVVFREILGLRADQIQTQFQIASDWLSGNPTDSSIQSPHVIRGLSPHAPYSVHPDLYRQLTRLAADRHAPVAVHLAETPAELELLRDGTGEFVRMLEKFGVWDDQIIPRHSRPLDYLTPLENVPKSLVIHGNYLSDVEIDWISQHPQVSVVYCPRTHAFFGHPPHAWQTMLARGINVAIGTDSRGSNPDLSTWKELCFLRSQFPGISPAILLKLGTLNGARALGLDQVTGSLEVGKRANLTMIHLPANGFTDPYELLFSASPVATL